MIGAQFFMPTPEHRRKLYGGKTEPYKKVRQGDKVTRNHRLVAEEKLWRPLEKGEVVHHLEGKDDTPKKGIQHLFSWEEVLEVIPPEQFQMSPGLSIDHGEIN